jgi:hypothetical protein
MHFDALQSRVKSTHILACMNRLVQVWVTQCKIAICYSTKWYSKSTSIVFAFGFANDLKRECLVLCFYGLYLLLFMATNSRASPHSQAILELWKQCNLTYNPCVSGADIRLNAYWRIQPTMHTCEKCCCIKYALLRWVHSLPCTCCIELKGNFVSYVEKRGSYVVAFHGSAIFPLGCAIAFQQNLAWPLGKGIPIELPTIYTSCWLVFATKYFSYACHMFIAGYGISWCA